MAVVKKNIGKALSHMPELAEVLYGIVDDLEALKAALESHTHTENASATYVQNATTSATASTVSLKTTKE